MVLLKTKEGEKKNKHNGMVLKIVDRKYLIGGKWFRYQRMNGVKDIGFKIAIGRYEFRFYKE